MVFHTTIATIQGERVRQIKHPRRKKYDHDFFKYDQGQDIDPCT